MTTNRSGTWIPWIPIVSGIPDSLSCFLDSKASGFGIQRAKISPISNSASKNSWIRESGNLVPRSHSVLRWSREIWVLAPHVRESKTLLDSGFHAVDSGFQLLDFRPFSVEIWFRIRIVSGIPDSYTCIPDSKAQDSGFHKQKFPRFWISNAKYPGFRNPDSFTCRELIV